MKKLIVELLLFIFLLAVANNILISCFGLPEFWAIKWQKPVFYEKHKSEVNCLFFGTSLTARQIRPALFDSINASRGIKTCSYNYGLDLSDFSEVFSTVKEVTANPPKALKYEIVELCYIDKYNSRFMGTLRFKSFYSFEHFYNSLRLMANSNLKIGRKLEEFFFNTRSYAEYLFKVDFMADAVKTKREIDNYNGNYDWGFEVSSRVDKNGNIDSIDADFLQDERSVTYLKGISDGAKSVLTNSEFQKAANLNPTYMAMVNRMFDDAHKKGITLIFLLPPRYGRSVYTYLVPIFKSIPETNRINVADSEQFPQFYALENSFGEMHMNSEGTKMYTRAIADQFDVLMHQPKYSTDVQH
jgi:hypothetical protein